MALHASAKKYNLVASFNNYFSVRYALAGGQKPINFGLYNFDTSKTDMWIKIDFLSDQLSPNNIVPVQVTVFSKCDSDPFGKELIQERDKVIGTISDSTPCYLYDYDTSIESPQLLGTILRWLVDEQNPGPDSYNVGYIPITVNLVYCQTLSKYTG